VRCFFAAFEDRQLPAEEFFIDARQLAWLQRPAIRESPRFMASAAANGEEDERNTIRRDLGKQLQSQ
jgi:hypothetical protein